MSIAENVKLVKENIAAAAIRCGRDPNEIKLVAATKMNDASRVREAIAAGVDICGENRVQELQEKLAKGHMTAARCISSVICRKTRLKTSSARWSSSTRSTAFRLRQEINRRAAALGITQDILLEVNIGAEENKSGFAPDELANALDEIAQFSSVRVLGLMAIPPICEISENNRVYFRRMKQLFIDIGQKKYDNVCMLLLSMGMSADYEVAVEEGASLVRVGTGIFGARNYK